MFWQLQEYIRRLLYVRGRVPGAALNTTLANAVRLGLMLWWAGLGVLSGTAALHAIAIGSLVALALGAWQTRGYWGHSPENISLTWRRNWGFGRFILGGTIANWLSAEFYPVLAAGIISFEAAGAYRALQNLVAPIHMLLRAVDTFLTPRAARAFHQNGYPALRRLLRLTYLVLAAPILGLLALAVSFPAPLLNLLYRDTFPAYQDGIYLMALFYALWFAYWPLQMILKAARFSRPIFVANLTAILVMFSLGVWMVYRWDLYGTIAGQALNAGIVTVVLWMAWRGIGVEKTCKTQRNQE
jgi:O-antigen/teichoic acid export membrane protein